MLFYRKGDKQTKRITLYRRVIRAVNLTLISILAVFLIWDYQFSLNAHIREKRVALEEETKVLLPAILRLREKGPQAMQNFIDETCGAMQESASPGHHIVVRMGSDVLQAYVHNRASEELFSAMQQASVTENGIVSTGRETIVTGMARQGDVIVYISEYLSNIKKIIRAQIIWRLVSITAAGFLVVFILNIMLRKLISEPLREMVGTVQQFSRGNLVIRMPHIETMELGTLADKFDEMASAIQVADSDREMRMKKAIDIQMKLLPVPSLLTDIKFTYIFRPAAEVAGDYLDIIRYPDDTFLFCVADVVGHGVPSAMEAAMLKAVLKIITQHESDLLKLIRQLHFTFCEATLEGDFTTAMLVHWEPVKEIITYISTGHETGYLARSNGEILELNPTGDILGIRELADWTQVSIKVSSGDRLIMLTDGITETFSQNGEMFGRQRLIEFLKRSRAEPISGLSESLLSDIISFRGQAKQTDDITFLVIEL